MVTFSNRATSLKGIIFTHCTDIISHSPPVIDVTPSRKYKETGTIEIESVCSNGSCIKIFEKIENGNIIKYSYLYEGENGFFFNYANDGDSDGIKKPLHHLHVGITKNANDDLIDLLPSELIEHGGPHYKVQEISINEFMLMIIVNYFYNHKNCDTMIEKLETTPQIPG